MSDKGLAQQLRLEKRALTWHAADAIERLTRELDDARKDTSVARQTLYEVAEQRNAALARAEAAERKVEKLREALEPFASCVAKDGLRTVVYPDHANTVDFLNARAALAETEMGDE